MTHRETELRRELESQLRFETLLSDISARFVNLPASDLDREIRDSQRRICQALDLDRSVLWQLTDPERGTLSLTHIYDKPSPTDQAYSELSSAGDWLLRYADAPQIPTDLDAGTYFPWAIDKIRHGETLVISSIDELPAEASRDRESFTIYGTKSTVIIPLRAESGGIGIVAFAATRGERQWPETLVKRFHLIAHVFSNALERKRIERSLRERLEEIEHLKRQLESENIYLRTEVASNSNFGQIIGSSKSLQQVFVQVEQVARTGTTVLIQGETGTGKELIAEAIHRLSDRNDRVMVKVNCAALPPTLIESELFGREKGAFTGALTKEIGRFELAHHSTIFLDEIGELSLEVQSKLLRVLQDGCFQRLGSPRQVNVDIRVIAATNRDLAEEVRSGRFRQDLFYRINVFPITILPLRERVEDIPLLVWSIVEEFSEKMGKKILNIPRQEMQTLQQYAWPGNIRELRNVIEYAMILNEGETLHVSLPESSRKLSAHLRTLHQAEFEHISNVLRATNWRVKGEGGAAQILALNPATLFSRMDKLGIPRRSEKDKMPH
jgi:formate hydrogenlyase transcriptional activator